MILERTMLAAFSRLRARSVAASGFMRVRRRAAALAVCLALPASALSAPPPVRIDHHMHVHSPAIRAWLPRYCASPGRSSPCDPDFADPPPLDALIAAMDRAGVGHGLLMSTGYLAQSAFVQPPDPDAAALLRAANDDVVALARAHPGRFSAFVAVNPLAPEALPELRRWRGVEGVAGVKIHVTNSGLDLRDDAHLQALAAVFAEARRNGWALTIHLRTRAADYGAVDVANFIEQVLPQAGDVPVQIAHAAGWGGTDANTFEALGAFAGALAARPALGRNLYFDLAAVFGDQTPDEDAARLAALIQRIGPAHFVAASDWPFALDLADYYGRVYPVLPLSPEAWRTIRTNTWMGRP